MALEQQTVAVVGAANGIGRAIAEGFLAEGCRVHGFDRAADPRPFSIPSSLFTGDVTVYDQVRGYADACERWTT